MKQHVTIIAWLNILLSLPLLILGILLMFGAGVVGLTNIHALPFIGGMGALAFLVMLLFSIPGLFLGWGLLNRAPWARILGIVVSILNLFSFHTLGIGTALGIYSLIILFNPETVALFEHRY